MRIGPRVVEMQLAAVRVDADREQMQLRPGRDPAVGAQHDLLGVLGEAHQAERPRRLQFLQHQREHGGTIRAGDVLDRDAVGRRVPAVVDMPAQDAVRAWGRRVEPFRRPGYPVGAVRQRHERQQLHPVAHAVPADRAVGIGGHHQPPVAGDVHRPHNAGNRSGPERRAVGLEGAQRPLRAQHEAISRWVDGEATGPLIPLESQRSTAERREEFVVPVLYRQAALAGGGHVPLGGRVEREGARRQIEPRRLLAEVGIAEADPRAVAGHRQRVELIAEIGLRWTMVQADGPSGRSLPSQGSAAAASRSPSGSGTRLVTVCCAAGRMCRLPAPASPQAKPAPFPSGRSCPRRTGSGRPTTRRHWRDAPRDARDVGPGKRGERMAVQQAHHCALAIADRQACPVGWTEGDAVRLPAVRRVDRDCGAHRALQFGGIQPHLAVKRGGRQPPVRGEGRAITLIAVVLVAGGLAPAPVAVV